MEDQLSKLRRGGVVRGSRGLVSVRLAMPMTRRDFTRGAVTAAALLATGLPRTAHAKTDVNYMGWQGYEDSLNAGGFLDKNDIGLRTTYISGNEEIITTAQSGGKGTLDLLTPDGAHTRFMAELGILEPLEVDRVPNLARLFPEFAAMDDTVVAGKRYAIPYMWGSIPLMYNAKVVKETPTSWLDLLKPEYKGKVALVEDMISMVVNFALTATDAEVPTKLTHDQLKATFDLMIKIKKEHARTIAATYGELAGLFATGEVVMAPAWQPVTVWAGANAPPLKWVKPKEGFMVFVDCVAMAAEAPHKDLNYKLLNQALSPEGQAKAAETNLTACTVKDAVPLLSEAPRGMYPYGDIAGFFAKSGGRMYPFYPIEADGQHATFDEVLEAWEGFLKA